LSERLVTDGQARQVENSRKDLHMDQWFWLTAIVVGLVSCFYGYPLFRILLIIAGFIYGFVLGQVLAPASHTWLSLACGLGLAVVLAVFAYPLWSMGVVLVGAVLGFVLLHFIGAALNTTPTIIILLGVMGAIVFGLLFYTVKDLLVMVATAFNGAALVVFGLSYYIPVMAFGGGRANLLDIVSMVVLGGLGLALQYSLFKGRKTYSI
jgi:hypothetical protein